MSTRTDFCRGDDCWVCKEPQWAGLTNDTTTRVCAGCTARVLGKDVAVQADFEHVLCMLCAADRRLRADGMLRVRGGTFP